MKFFIFLFPLIFIVHFFLSNLFYFIQFFQLTFHLIFKIHNQIIFYLNFFHSNIIIFVILNLIFLFYNFKSIKLKIMPLNPILLFIVFNFLLFFILI